MRRAFTILLSSILLILLTLSLTHALESVSSCNEVNHATEDCLVVACALAADKTRLSIGLDDRGRPIIENDSLLVYNTHSTPRNPANPLGSQWELVGSVHAYKVTSLGDYQGGVTCTLPPLPLETCSMRGTPYVITTIIRYYTASGTETRTLTSRLRTKCEDKTPPNATLEEFMVNWEEGSMNLTLHLTDNETLLLNGEEGREFTDTTTLSSCTYQLEGPKGKGAVKPLPCAGKLEFTGTINLTRDELEQVGCINPTSPDACGIRLSLTDTPFTSQASEGAGNHADIFIPLPISLYEANGKEGYCPRPQECLADPSSSLIDVNTFTTQDGFTLPVCVEKGAFVNDYICTEDGWDTRSHTLLNQLSSMTDTFSLTCLPQGMGMNTCPLTPSQLDASCTLQTICLLTTPGSMDGTLAGLVNDDALYDPDQKELHITLPRTGRLELPLLTFTRTSSTSFEPLRLTTDSTTRRIPLNHLATITPEGFLLITPSPLPPAQSTRIPSHDDVQDMITTALTLLQQKTGESFTLIPRESIGRAYQHFAMSATPDVFAFAFTTRVEENVNVSPSTGSLTLPMPILVAYYHGYTPRLCTGEAEDLASPADARVYCQDYAHGTLLVKTGDEATLLTDTARYASSISYPLTR